LAFLKSYKTTGEFDEAMFQGVKKPYELISCILGIEKATWMMSLY
jgi:hypothetical protein